MTYAPQTYAWGTTGCPNTYTTCGELASVPARSLYIDSFHGGTTLFPVHARLRGSDENDPLPAFILADPFDSALLVNPYEAHIFSIDFEDRFEALTRTAAEFFWLGLTRKQPPGVVLPATTQPFGPTPTELHLTPGDFNSPNNSGTIRSAYLSQAGGCSQEFAYADLFAQIDTGLRGSLFTNHGAACFTTDSLSSLTLAYDNFASFIAHTQGRVQDLRGGFVMNGDVRLQISNVALELLDVTQGVNPGPDEKCDAAFSSAFRLFVGSDGVVAAESSFGGGPAGVDGHGNAFPSTLDDQPTRACNGVHVIFPPYFVDIPGLSNTLTSALTDDIPRQIHDTAQALQMYPKLDDFSDSARDTLFACDPVKGDPNYTCPADPSEQCKAAAKTVRDTASEGAKEFGMAASDANTLAETIMATSGGHLVHWGCVPFPSSVDRSNACVNPHHGRCEIIVPMKRLNYRPQAAEAVLFDRLDEINNPALALFYASFMTDAPPLGHVDFTRTDWFTKICTARRAPLVDAGIDLANFYNEDWAFKNGGPATCPSSETPAGPCAVDCDTRACVQPICTQGNTSGCTPPATNPTNGQCQ